ncbi:YifB family Mg chelatase-like AAA ATPase [Metabacillus sp. B2-18]|uniref:YifB family Mg chelatase-like AAA ATPase n=1 Tax=Metabacillus sp. B2-18 TaxID=2897333 RepID=UPI001E3EA40E|nr:YifB family Mg chelatase-like AAA ATPase [Metabacillus sp. B2-18]UGB30552.1 YifB family Mg chelatase-like AAA ATPase [Metabacillus sp. B2-18]
MTVKISSVGLRGLEGYRVQVEVQVRPGVESMVIVGLPDTSVKESKERVLSSIRSIVSSGTAEKVVVNLSPSEQKKNGPLFDLPIAIGILKEKNYIKEQIPPDTMFIGALSLDGTIERVEGMLPALIAAVKLGYKRAFLPYDPRIPIDMLSGIECVVVQHIKDVINLLCGQPPLSLQTFTPSPIQEPPFFDHQKDFSHIIGHQFTKEALEIAAAGGHNVLMSGPPGCGKSLLAETFPSILPPLSKSAQLEVISLYQLANERLYDPQMAPFRHPHHSASAIAIIGGGSYPKPGEISLAHHGVLFLDEMAEFTKKTLDMLRQPLETGKVTISRVHSTVTYPASFILIGAMNPCPCGYLGSSSHYCTCSQKQIKAYRNRVSGPVYDRMDILLSLNSVDLDQVTGKEETSLEIRCRVGKAREMQFTRYQEQVTNAKVAYDLLIKTSPLTEKQQKIIMREATKNQWSNRVQIEIFRLARTIADLAGELEITEESVWKAIQLRRTVFRELR